MTSFMLDRGMASSASTGGLLTASPSAQSHLQPSASPSPAPSFSSLAAPSATQLAQLGLPSGTVALPGPNGSIIWAAPQPQPAASAAASGALQLLSAGLMPQSLQPASASPSSLPSFALNGLSALSLPSLSQLLAVSQQQQAAQQQQQQQQQVQSQSLSSPHFSAPLSLANLNLNSLLFSPYQPVLPLSAANSGLAAAPLQSPPQPQPQSQQSASALSSPPFTALSSAGGSELGASTNAALLQLQATLLQVAQTGNQQAVQQLQGLNALMQQCGQTQASPQQLAHLPAASAHSPPAAPLLPLPPFVSGGVGANCADGGYLSGGSRNSCVSPLSGSLPQRDSPADSSRVLQSASLSAFKPRAKRERGDGGYSTTSGSGGNSSCSGGNSSGGSAPASSRSLSGGRHVSSKQALKSSHLRHDVREAVAANHARMELESAAAAVVAASTGHKDGAVSSSILAGSGGDGTGNSSSSSGGGSGSGSDEDRRNQADDEDDSERENKRRRKKHTAALHAAAGGIASSSKHPFHLFASLDALHRSLQPQSTASSSSSVPSLPAAPDAALLKAAANNPLVYLPLSNYQQQHSSSSPQLPAVSSVDTAALSRLKLPTGEVVDINGGNKVAVLSALTSYLQSASKQVQPLFPAVAPLSSQQQQQQQAQPVHQSSESSQSQDVPAVTSSGHLPLQVVSQQVAGQYAHQRGSGSGSDSGSGSSSSDPGSSSSSSGASPGLAAASEHEQPPALPSQSDSLPAFSSSSSAPSGGKKLRKKHIVTDRQRRAKIKEGMEQLRSLLSCHGSFTTDQVSIMTASVQLIQKLKGELSTLKSHTSQLKDELHGFRQLHTDIDPAVAAAAAAAMPPLSLASRRRH